jgi:hypothetical protein
MQREEEGIAPDGVRTDATVAKVAAIAACFICPILAPIGLLMVCEANGRERRAADAAKESCQTAAMEADGVAAQWELSRPADETRLRVSLTSKDGSGVRVTYEADDTNVAH